MLTHTNVGTVCQALKDHVIANGAFAITSRFDPTDLNLGVVESKCPPKFNLVLRDWIKTFGPNADFANLKRCDFYKNMRFNT